MGLQTTTNLEISSSGLLAVWKFEQLVKQKTISEDTLVDLIPQLLTADLCLTQSQVKRVLEIVTTEESLIACGPLLNLPPAEAAALLRRPGGAALLLAALRRAGDGREQARKNFCLLVEHFPLGIEFLPFIFSKHSVLEISSVLLNPSAGAAAPHYCLRLFDALIKSRENAEILPACLRSFCVHANSAAIGFAFLTALIDRVAPDLEIETALWREAQTLHLYRPREDSSGAQASRLSRFLEKATAASKAPAVAVAFALDPSLTVASGNFFPTLWGMSGDEAAELSLGVAVLRFLAEKGDLLSAFPEACGATGKNLLQSVRSLPDGCLSFSPQVQEIWKFLLSSQNWDVFSALLQKVSVRENEVEISRCLVSETFRTNTHPQAQLAVSEFFLRGPYAWQLPSARTTDSLFLEIVPVLKSLRLPGSSRAAALRFLVAPPQDADRRARLLRKAVAAADGRELLQCAPGERRCAAAAGDVDMEIPTPSPGLNTVRTTLKKPRAWLVEQIPELLDLTLAELGNAAEDETLCRPLPFVTGSRSLPAAEAKWRAAADPRAVLERLLLSEKSRPVAFACAFLLEGPLKKSLGSKTVSRVLSFIRDCGISAQVRGRALVALAGAAREQPHLQTAEALLDHATCLAAAGDLEGGYFCFYTALVSGRDRSMQERPWWASSRCELILRAWRAFLQASIIRGDLALWTRLSETIATSSLPRQCVLFILEICSLLQASQEKLVRPVLRIFMKKLGKKETRHLHAIADGKLKDSLKSEIESFENRHRFKGKV